MRQFAEFVASVRQAWAWLMSPCEIESRVPIYLQKSFCDRGSVCRR